MKIKIVEKNENEREIEIDSNFVGVMNHRDLTVDYRYGQKNVRFKLTEESFYGLIDHYKEEEAKREDQMAEYLAEKEAEESENNEEVDDGGTDKETGECDNSVEDSSEV